MRIKITIFIFITLLMVGCSNNKPKDLISENINTIDLEEETMQDIISEIEQNNKGTNLAVEEKLANIGFKLISGQYTRKVLQEEIEYTEMITTEKNSFLRIASNELEQEVYAYNYESDDFTYLYYFDIELISKTKFNIATGAILVDDEGYAELLTIDAQELKLYFFDLMNEGDLEIEELSS